MRLFLAGVAPWRSGGGGYDQIIREHKPFILESFYYADADEAYSTKEARRAVYAGLIAALAFVGTGVIVNLMQPNELDFASDALHTLLSFSVRATSASILFFFLSNLADVWLFDRFRRHSTKNLWLRNNVSTILCNCLENFLFIFAAFYGVMSAKDCFMIAVTSSVVETITGLLDTPFVYLGRKIAAKEPTYPEMGIALESIES